MSHCICFRLFLIYTSSMRNNHTWEGIPSRTLQMKCMKNGLPSEVHLPQSSGSSPSPRSLLSAHILVYLHPRWWWSIMYNRDYFQYILYTSKIELSQDCKDTGKKNRFCKSSGKRRAHLYFIDTKRKLNLTHNKCVCTAIIWCKKRSMLEKPLLLPDFSGRNEKHNAGYC